VTAATRRELAALGAILIAAAAIRVATAGYSLWFDELASLVFAHQPQARLWSDWMIRESNPPLYYSLLRVWIGAFGESDRIVRLLSILIGLGGIVAGWALARRLGGAAAGLIAAALLALSASHVAFSQEARSYVLAYSATLVALIGAADVLDHRRRGPVIYAAATLVALYSHTTMIVFALLAGATVAVMLRRSPRALAEWLAANVLIAVGWAWWAAISLRQMSAAHTNFDWIKQPSIRDAVDQTAIAYLPTFLAEVWPAGAVLLAGLAAMVVTVVRRDRRPTVILLKVLVFLAPATLFALSQIKPIFLYRTLYWANGPATVLIALFVAGLASAQTRRRVFIALLATEALFLAAWLAFWQLEEWPSALRAIASADPHAIVLVEGDAMALAAAHYRPAVSDMSIVELRPRMALFDSWAQGLYQGPHVDAAGAAELLDAHRRLFILTRHGHDPAWALRGVGYGQPWTAASHGRKPLVWVWRARPQAALSMPSSPSLR
jgi:uncharacterized membrane protein